MYSSEDLERFYLDYQSEWVPRGMTLQAYCSRNNVPYKVMENYSRNIQKKIVEVKVVGRPTEEPQQSVPSSPSFVQPKANSRSNGSQSVVYRWRFVSEMGQR